MDVGGGVAVGAREPHLRLRGGLCAVSCPALHSGAFVARVGPVVPFVQGGDESLTSTRILGEGKQRGVKENQIRGG